MGSLLLGTFVSLIFFKVGETVSREKSYRVDESSASASLRTPYAVTIIIPF